MNVSRRFQHRILAVLAGVTLLVASVFSLYTVVFVYEVEDAFFNRLLQEEGEFQSAQRMQAGRWAPPRDSRIELHSSRDTLPESVRELLESEPERVEFPGEEGRYYHLLAVQASNDAPAWLLMEVRDQLVVRPIRNSLLRLLCLTTLIVVALALAAGYVISHRLTRRLSHLADEVARLDPARLPVQWPATAGNDEVSVVARGLASMSSRLREFIARERSFTSDASHELRTPLAVVRSASDQLLQQPELSALSRRHAVLIADSTVHLEHTVSTLLALAREEHALASADDVRLLPLLERIIVDQSPRLVGRSVEVDVDVPDTTCMRAPPGILAIILANLVGNAFAHTDGGVVRIWVQENALCIRNPTREGADFTARQAVAFRKGPDSEGFGLGLAIVQRLSARYQIALALEHRDDEVVVRMLLRSPAIA
jgi:signal transduction histidine kinase